MVASVLVAYATRYGSTREVAEVVAETLGDHDLEVDIHPVKAVRALTGYRAVVLGAPIYYGTWQKDARRFLLEHHTALEERPIAVFALGPVRDPIDEDEWQGSRAALEQQLEKFPWLTPLALEMFGGKFDPVRLRLPDNLVAKLPVSPIRQMPASDILDWTAIRAWAGNLAEKLQQDLSGR